MRNKTLAAVIVFFIFGAFLRFYRLDTFVTFLGDQGRDAIIIKRMLTFEHFPAIGAPTSIGQVYLGPFYYYFIAPWLFLFRFNPIGLAAGTAVLSSLFIIIHFFLVQEIFNRKTALISTILLSISAVIVSFSRFSWNPNLLPLFTLVTIYLVIQSLKTNAPLFYILAGAFLSFSIQLHYLALILFLPLAIVFFSHAWEYKKKIKELLVQYGYCALSFLFFSSPLVIFDLRHRFLNTDNFIALLKTSSNVATNKLTNALDVFSSLNMYTFGVKFHPTVNTVLFFIITALLVFFIIRLHKNMRIFFIFFLFSLLSLSLFGGPKFEHYLGILYLPYFVFLAYLLHFAAHSRIGIIAITLFIMVFFYFNMKNYHIDGQGSYQIQTAQNRAKIIFDNITDKKFTVTSLPVRTSDSTYRYFLEIWGKRPIEKDSLEKANELFVVCEESCWPIGDPQWDIAYFAPNIVAGTWDIHGGRIYKLKR